MTLGTMTGAPNGLAYLRTAAVTFSQASFGFKARMQPVPASTNGIVNLALRTCGRPRR
jgi:hypothetical protein